MYADNPYAFTSDCWDKGNNDHWEATDAQFTIWPAPGKGIAALNCAKTDEADISVDVKPSGKKWSGGLVFWAEYEQMYFLSIRTDSFFSYTSQTMASQVGSKRPRR
jgi:hypothetical protein